MVALLCFLLAVLASPFKSKSRLDAENVALRHQVMILQRKVRGPGPAHEQRSLVLCPVVSMVSVDSAGAHDHPSRDARALASSGLSLLLGLEVALTGRAAEDRDGAPCVDPADEH
jgi:hypothetical protein